jgi:glycosyltransferase involved in cell wall biosynthesis
MKIVHIIPGFGGTFYCGNCLRDSGVVAALRQAGHEAISLPMYLPLNIGDAQTNQTPVFYGAVNIFLKQYSLFRNMPSWFEKWMNSAPVLRMAASMSGSTRATGLESLTESMLLGADGFQRDELQQVVDYLKNHEKPDIVHFSNALLLGMAKEIREQVKVPVVFSLQDEDVWVDVMNEQYKTKIWQLMAEKARDVDAFIAVSHYFGVKMQKLLHLPAEKLKVLHVGITPQDYKINHEIVNPPVIGYLSRVCEENGFAILVDAFIALKSKPGFESIRLIATGGLTGDDTRFIHHQEKKIKDKGFEADFVIDRNFDQNNFSDFFKQISVLTVPVIHGEAFGLYQLEALASGIPLVQPALGAFPEIIEATGGGVTYFPNTPETLASKWSEVLTDTVALKQMGLKGRKAVEQQFDISIIAKRMTDIYESLISDFKNNTK